MSSANEAFLTALLTVSPRMFHPLFHNTVSAPKQARYGNATYSIEIIE
jgi:hypothetical protein